MAIISIDHNKHCELEFGLYVQVHNNSLLPRTSGALALQPTVDAQGVHYFLSLHTDRRISNNNWTQLPMPNKVIVEVH